MMERTVTLRMPFEVGTPIYLDYSPHAIAALELLDELDQAQALKNKDATVDTDRVHVHSA